MCSMGEAAPSSWTRGSPPQAGVVLSAFPNFDKLTSVHVNCTDDYMLASGYSHNVAMYDLETGAVVRYAVPAANHSSEDESAGFATRVHAQRHTYKQQ
jgi:hypothetical protein